MLDAAPDILAAHAAATPDKPAMYDAAGVLSWRDFIAARDALAGALGRLGLAAADHVLLLHGNAATFYTALTAVSRLGAVAAPMNARLMPIEVAEIIDSADAAAVIFDEAHRETADAARLLCQRRPLWISTGVQPGGWYVNAPALVADAPSPPPFAPVYKTMSFTGGTTGRPKGAVRSSSAAVQLTHVCREIGLDRADHVHLVAGPLYHAGPLAFAGITLMFGGTLVIMERFEAKTAWRLVRDHRCTTAFMAPILLKRFVEAADAAPHSLQALVVSGAPCPQSVKEQAIDAIGPVYFEFYGATETALCTLLRPEDVKRKPGSCGRASPGVSLKIVTEDGVDVERGEGELYVHADAGVFDGYYNASDATAETRRGAWTSVGDVAFIDEDGFVFIRDRKRDMIISGGVNIYSAEVENAIHAHPSVADVAVFGAPDAVWGEHVHAAIVTRDGPALDEDALLAFLKTRLADFKLPRSIAFHASLPRDQAGKLRKRLLRDALWQETGRSL